jgi:hypothetical protein
LIILPQNRKQTKQPKKSSTKAQDSSSLKSLAKEPPSWLTPIILATQEAEIRRTMGGNQPHCGK